MNGVAEVSRATSPYLRADLSQLRSNRRAASGRLQDQNQSWAWLSIHDGVAGSGAVRPVDRGDGEINAIPLDFFVFSRSTRPRVRSGIARADFRTPRILPCHIGLVTTKIGKGTETTRLVFLVVDITIIPRGTLHASVVKHALVTLVTKERARELPDPEKVPLLDLICLADAEEAKLADGPSSARVPPDMINPAERATADSSVVLFMEFSRMILGDVRASHSHRVRCAWSGPVPDQGGGGRGAVGTDPFG
jgi:hypothetical protein